MIQIIVATHGHMAEELVKTAELIIGCHDGLTAVVLEMHEGIDDLARKLDAATSSAELGKDGCLVLVDMFGGTPSNVALVLSKRKPLAVVTGVNLPMVIEALTHRQHETLARITEMVLEKGRAAILHANEFLK